jgi:Tfp pilus assembly protein PilX
MKKILNRPIRDEKGQALLIVLILLLVGGLIIAPLLGYMSAGLKAGQSNENLMQRLYAADAGVEDAIWRIRTDDPSLPTAVGANVTYPITGGVNNKQVSVTIKREENIAHFLEVLLNKNNLHLNATHADWTVVDDATDNGTYTITITYSGAATKKSINGVGAWLEGTYSEVGVATGNMTALFPNYVKPHVVQSYAGGTAFEWEWTGSDKPEFRKPDRVCLSLIFHFTPTTVTGFHFSWFWAGSADIGIVTSAINYGVFKITSTATDNSTGKQTEVVSYVGVQGPIVSIATWEVSLK